jgi:tripartite-type tricarboxylate transporter receptor subunit TctC
LCEVAAIASSLQRLVRPIAMFAMALVCLTAAAAHAQPVEDFYRGRTVNLVIGYSVGGGYDMHGRMLARHLGKHIPGNPGIVVQNMPGGGSLRAANFLYNAAPKDGSTIGIFSRGMAMEPLIGASNTQYDARKFTWLGSITNEASVCATSSTSKVKTWDDLLATPFTVAGEGSGSDPDIFATMIKNVFGAKLRLVAGYPGSAEMTLAIERGEVDGRCGWTWSSIKLQRPDWITGHRLNVLVQLASHRIPDLADVPLLTEHATTERQRQIVNVILGRQVMGRPVVAPPAIPVDRKQALRRAFDATMADPGYVAEATSRGLEINPVGGADLDKLLDDLYATPPDVIAEVRAIIAPGAK